MIDKSESFLWSIITRPVTLPLSRLSKSSSVSRIKAVSVEKDFLNPYWSLYNIPFDVKKSHRWSQMCLSRSLDKTGRSEIRMQLLQSGLLPFPLNTGVTLAIFQADGKTLFDMHRFNSLVRDGSTAGAAILKILMLMSSSPVALLLEMDKSS